MGDGNLRQVYDALRGRVLKRGDVVGYVENEERAEMCIVDGRWFGVCVEGNHGDLAKGEIAAEGLITYWPMVPRQERHGRSAMRTVWRPVFPGYLLVKCDPKPDHWRLITAARGVRRLLGVDSPLSISDDEIEVIRLYEAEEREKWHDRQRREQARLIAQQKGRSGLVWDFKPGERKRIKYGPFASFYAELTAAVDEHDRIKALVTAFGRASSTELSAFDLEA